MIGDFNIVSTLGPVVSTPNRFRPLIRSKICERGNLALRPTNNIIITYVRFITNGVYVTSPRPIKGPSIWPQTENVKLKASNDMSNSSSFA